MMEDCEHINLAFPDNDPPVCIDCCEYLTGSECSELIQSLQAEIAELKEVFSYIHSELSNCPDRLTMFPPKDKYEAVVVNIKKVVTKALPTPPEAE